MELVASVSKLSTELERRSDRAMAQSGRQLETHQRLQIELAAIQEELERRVSLARRRQRKPPWTSSS